MEFHVITLFPELFAAANWPGMVGRALKAELIKIAAHALRDHGLGNYRQIDDTPYGGGSGMVMRPEPIAAAIDSVLQQHTGLWRVLLTPQGELFRQPIAADLAKREPGLLLIAGRYEGVDERVRGMVATTPDGPLPASVTATAGSNFLVIEIFDFALLFVFLFDMVVKPGM